MERLFDFKNTIDDSPKTVARHFMKKYRPALLAKKKHRMTAVKLTDDQLANIGDQIIKQARAKGSKRSMAFDMYHAGASAADVSKTLCITYANAHYYKRAFKKEFG